MLASYSWMILSDVCSLFSKIDFTWYSALAWQYIKDIIQSVFNFSKSYLWFHWKDFEVNLKIFYKNRLNDTELLEHYLRIMCTWRNLSFPIFKLIQIFLLHPSRSFIRTPKIFLCPSNAKGNWKLMYELEFTKEIGKAPNFRYNDRKTGIILYT